MSESSKIPPAEGTAPPTSLRSLTSLLVAVALAMAYMWSTAKEPKTDFSALALGKDNKAGFAIRDGYPIHIKDYEEIPKLIEGVQRHDQSQTVLWLGNSQLHAINQAPEGAEPAPAKLHDLLASQKVNLVAASYPNANLQEHYLTTEYLLPRLPQLSTVILSVVFDDLRETGIRNQLVPMLNDKTVATHLASRKVGEQLLASHLEEPDESAPGESILNEDMAALRNTFQERSETFLNNGLDEHWPLWAARKQARGRVFLDLYNFRNYAFNIRAQSKRRMIRPRYEVNSAALEALLTATERENVQVLLYIVPLRMDVETPYVMEEYEQFKEEVEVMAKAHQGIVYKNLESLVPNEYWGTKTSTSIREGDELDFMHFQEPGHTLLAERIYQDLLPLTEGNSDE